MKRMLMVLLGAAVIAGVEARGAQGNDLKIGYAAPAAKWTEALPLGNGRLGAMVFGGVQRERIQCNEISLWSGWPEQENDRVGAYDALVKVRQLLREGKRDEAGKVAVKEFLSEKGYGKPDFGAYQSFCDVLLDFEGLPEKGVPVRPLPADRVVAARGSAG